MHNIFRMEAIVMILIVLVTYTAISLVWTRVIKFHWLLRYLFGFTILPLFLFLTIKNYQMLESIFPKINFLNQIRTIFQPFIFFTVPVFLCYVYYLFLAYLNKFVTGERGTFIKIEKWK